MANTHWTRCLLICVVTMIASQATNGQSIVDPGQGPVSLTGGPGGLSGLTFTGGDAAAGRFRFVGDSGGAGALATVGVNTVTGAIDSASVPITQSYAYSSRVDLEGIAYDANSGQVWVSDEADQSLKRYPLSGGPATGSVAVPAIYQQARNNLSFESLSMQAGGRSLWTGNEEALQPDGPTGPGTLVRLQKFDANFDPAGQWAYETGGSQAGWLITQNSGLVDLTVLPHGTVLALERAVGAVIPNILNPSAAEYRLRNRIYRLNIDHATDITDETSLANPSEPFEDVDKTLLWEGFFTNHNFEGMALGASLDNPGDYSLLLISDDDNFPSLSQSFVTVPRTSMKQSLYALNLTDVVVPEPATSLLLGGGVLLLLMRRP